MELYDESELQKSKKNNKITNIILIMIILIILIIIGLVVGIMLLKENKIIVTVDGKKSDELLSIIEFDDDNSKIYIPIKKVAPYLGYNCYNGDYSQPSEDTSKCYVQSENEVTNFSLNSDTIYKMKVNTDSNYEAIQIDEPIKAINGELYTTIDGLEKAFNISCSYKDNKIEIYTIDFLTSYYSSVIVNYGYTNIDEDFNNKKSILANMLVVRNDNKYGVIDINGNVILDAKYDNIQYIQNTSDFLVKSNNKVGIISKEKQTKVSVSYDNIELMDNDSNLYLIQQNNKYGVIDINGNIKIHPEYDKIGIDINLFKYNNVKNGYILIDSLIPVQKDNLWGLFDKAGNKIVDFKYNNLGYVQNSSQNINNLLIVPNYDVIVVEKDGKYNLITLKGKEVIGSFVDGIYTTIEGGETKYYISYNEKTIDLLPLLKQYSASSNNKSTEINNTTTDDYNTVTNNTVVSE